SFHSHRLTPLFVASSFFMSLLSLSYSFFFFFNVTSTSEIYTLSLHDALPIFLARRGEQLAVGREGNPVDDARVTGRLGGALSRRDRKSTRLNSSHRTISYAVFCLKKKKKK